MTLLILLLIGNVVTGLKPASDGAGAASKMDSPQIVRALERARTYEQVESRVVLQTRLLRAEWEGGDADLLRVSLVLELKIFNGSTRTSVFHREALEVSHVWVGESEEALLSGDYEQSSSLTNLRSEIPTDSLFSKEDFIFIDPKKSHKIIREIVLFVPRVEGNRFEGAVSRGNHYIKVRINDQNWTPEELSRFKRVVGNGAELILASLDSEPISVCLDVPRKT